MFRLIFTSCKTLIKLIFLAMERGFFTFIDTFRTMKPIPHDLKCSLYWFVNSISKGLLDNPAWELDPIDQFNSGQLNWDEYLATINDPTIISTAFTIWMNNTSS
jgi:hypothetical protein